MAARLPYPPARLADVIDDYHGVRVADPYRWLERAADPETEAWVAAQNALTRRHVEGPRRDGVVARLRTLYDFPRTTSPIARGERLFYTHNDGLQNQPVAYVQDGPGGGRRALVDPNAIDPDGTTALTALAVDEEGTRVAYALSRRGSDRQDILVRDVATGTDGPDVVRWAKFASITWLPDGSGFYYTRFPEPGAVPEGDEHYYNRVSFHRLGDDQADDALVFDRPADREIVFQTAITGDGRMLVISAFKGASDRSEVLVLDRTRPGEAPRPLFTGFGAAYHLIDEDEGRLYFLTDEAAPLGRIVALDRGDLSKPPVGVVPESADKVAMAAIVGHRLFVAFLREAASAIGIFALDGSPAGEIELPGLGTISEMEGRPADAALFFTFTSFTSPPRVYRHEVASGRLTAFSDPPAAIDPSAYETRRVWYASKDGARVSMFLVHRKGLGLDGRRPVLLTGYGGFNISLTPAFDPAIFVWLDRGGVFALANLRGGGEYGEAWHEAGMRDRKQTVFDDFIAAADWLVAHRYTTSSRLAIEGGSNGGLLVGAVMVQRPDLVGAVVCRVPVADMLRYHTFTVGRFWIPEYGSSENPEEFQVLYAYSPLHNVRDGVPYPATLVMTADTDDRVAPGMAKKFAARLQAATSGDAPILIRVETKAGHGAGKPVAKVIEEDADIFSFLFQAIRMDEE